ncbi:transcription factor-like 5 protein isoform X1 [Gymnogyps californianus]|uniref:transcription factor-like 5 protein isoform X1 n=1 Tax=Gymnogyps californianus TaxID=33616 RepID=UPI0021C61E80|nr:transcription factor-like 5 protein isoform X1 [Gymnogyps californianus]XP_050763350.1 transcription factor-like 5 protein isoform X1 [Gymnogyps californianus]
MSGSAPEEPQTSIPQSTASVPDPAPVAVGPGGSSDVSFGEQNLSFTTTDVSLVEMMEIEYTQLQHILYSHTEAQASEGEVEARLNSFSSPGNSAEPPLHQTSLNTSQEGCSSNSSGNQSVYPVICQSGLPSDSNLLSSNPHLGYADFQELRMMLLSESNLPLNQTDKTPNTSSVEVPGHSLVKVKHSENFVGMNKGNILVENSALAPEPRSKSAVRVRLEDRFNSIQTENPRCQEPQESGVTLNNLVTLIRQPSELIGVPLHQQENKCAAVGKNKTAPATPSLQFTYPLFTMNACSTAGSANPSQAQISGTSCTVLEAAKHQDLGIPKTLSFCYQEIESTKQAVGAMNKALPEEVWIKVGDALCKQAINRSCSRISPLDPNTDRKPLGEIQNRRDDSQSSASAPGPWQSAQSNSSMQVQSGTQDGVAQRRERHNRMERDRRRRIRICCDELNLLVPFCTVDTDKATTLQWTTAFLKYIQERHGDSLKQEFETVFCGKTGRRLKIARSDSFVTCPVQENTHGYGEQVV